MPQVQQASPKGPLPIVPYLRGIEEGDPHLEGTRCEACGAIFLDERRVCSSCTARDRMAPVRLADRGTLHVYSIVHRSFPGIPTPYVSAVVDLDGGGSVKGNLVGVEPVPERIQMGMPVRVVYRTVPQRDAQGNEYLAYFFEPATAN